MHIEQKVAFFHGYCDEVYGAHRILADLRADEEIISRKTVAATMRRVGSAGICPRLVTHVYVNGGPSLTG